MPSKKNQPKNPEENKEKVRAAMDLVDNGMTVKEACAQVGLATPWAYYHYAKEFKGNKKGTKTASPKKPTATPKDRKIEFKEISLTGGGKTLLIVTEDSDLIDRVVATFTR